MCLEWDIPPWPVPFLLAQLALFFSFTQGRLSAEESMLRE
jgi:hypothetical protein